MITASIVSYPLQQNDIFKIYIVSLSFELNGLEKVL